MAKWWLVKDGTHYLPDPVDADGADEAMLEHMTLMGYHVTDEPEDEGRARYLGWTAFPEFGAFFQVGPDGELLVAAMMADGTIEKDGETVELGLCVSDEPEGFIEAINKEFGTKFTERDFPGR